MLSILVKLYIWEVVELGLRQVCLILGIVFDYYVRGF